MSLADANTRVADVDAQRILAQVCHKVLYVMCRGLGDNNDIYIGCHLEARAQSGMPKIKRWPNAACAWLLPQEDAIHARAQAVLHEDQGEEMRRALSQVLLDVLCCVYSLLWCCIVGFLITLRLISIGHVRHESSARARRRRERTRSKHWTRFMPRHCCHISSPVLCLIARSPFSAFGDLHISHVG